MTHSELVVKAKRWLKAQGCVVIITEMANGGSQEPDAIGWKYSHSIMVECKASRADFLKDKNKSHQKLGKSMGDERYYLAKSGLIKIEELPEKWGLIELSGRSVRIILRPGWCRREKDYQGEINLILSAFRRVEGIMPEGVSAKFYTYETKNRATVGIAKRKLKKKVDCRGNKEGKYENDD